MKRSTGQQIVREGSESILSEVLHDAYQMDLEYGAVPSVAAFVVTRASLPSWKWKYFDEAFGSWSVISRSGDARVDFDGKDSILFVTRGSGAAQRYVWENRISNVKEEEWKSYFRCILT